MYAVLREYEGAVRLLLSREDIAVNSRDHNGFTALTWAVSEGFEIGVRLLLSRSDIEVTSQDLEIARLEDPVILKLLEEKMDESNEAAAQ